MLIKIILLITTLLTSLISGFFYAYSCSVNPGLARLTDTEYIRAMQSINRAVLNPVFFASFFGTLLLLPVSCWMWFMTEGLSTGFYLLLAASTFYIVGVLGVTGLGNVPLNESLDKFNINVATPQEISAQRTMFEAPWNRYHNVRTWSNIISLGFLLLVIVGQVNF